MKVNTLKLSSADFPEMLAKIPSAPRQIYWAGAPPSDWMERPKVAIVGSRKVTPYGVAVTNRLAEQLAEAGVVIISGLALGIDSIAHRAALRAEGTTVAVIATSMARISPPSNTDLANQITERGGTLISEYDPADGVFLSNFVIRNRIVSALADVLLITEAALKSGSLHTARFALEQGKTVMAVPGNINSPASEGCNNLIKSGAVPVTAVDDVFFALKLTPKKIKENRLFSGSPQEQTVLRLIKEGICAQEELAAAAQLDTPAMTSALTMLEISGHIRPAGGGNWLPA